MKKITCTSNIEEKNFSAAPVEFWEEFFTRLAEEEPLASFYATCWFFSLSAGAGSYYKAPASTEDELYLELGLELLVGGVAMEAAVNTGFFQSGVRALVEAVIADEGQDADLRGLMEVLYIGSAFRAMLPKVLCEQGRALLQSTEHMSRKCR